MYWIVETWAKPGEQFIVREYGKNGYLCEQTHVLYHVWDLNFIQKLDEEED